jgi:hypothetical protein
MRLEYTFELSEVELPRFSVEAVEGIGKLFTLGALVLNVLQTRPAVQLVFHGINPEDPTRKIAAFSEILKSAPGAPAMTFEPGSGSRVPDSSAYYRWLTVRRG